MPSTSLRDIVYDPAARTLDVTFIASGRRYRYFDVVEDEYGDLRRAFSKGAHFNRAIKPRHRYTLLPDSSAPLPRPISATISKYSTAASHVDKSEK